MRTAPNVAVIAAPARDAAPSKSSAPMRIVDPVAENPARSSVRTPNSSEDPEAAAEIPATGRRRLQFSSAFGGNANRVAEATRPVPPYTWAT